MSTETLPRLAGEAALAAYRAGALLIDVRSEAGRHRDGEVHGAVVVPKTDVVEFVTRRIAPRPENQKVIVFCTSIKGSEPIVQKLRAAGIAQAFDVEGGFAALTGTDGLTPIERPKA